MRTSSEGKVFISSSTIVLIFVILKLTGTISWSWWWVLAPWWLPPCIIVAFLLSAAIIFAILALIILIYESF